MHLSLHVRRHNLEGTRTLHTELRAGGHFVATDVVWAHVHVHVAVGQHDFTGMVHVVSHDADGGVAIDSVGVP